MIVPSFVLASNSRAEQLTIAMGVKSDKTFEEIVERLAALFRMQPRLGDRDYEVSIDDDVTPTPASAFAGPPPSPRSNKRKK